MIRYLYILVFMLLLVSCKKENSKRWTEVRINTTNPVTNEPIEDVFCGVYRQTGGILNSGVEELGVSNTENGVYEFGFKAKRNKTYWAEAAIDIEKYYAVKFSNFMNLSSGEINEFDFELVPYGHIRFHFKNESCFNSDDEMIFKIDHHLFKYQSEDWNPFPKTGCYEELSSNYDKIPIGSYDIVMKITKNNVENYDTVEVTLNEEEWKTVELFY